MYDFLDLPQAEAFVENESKRGRTVFWSGWDIISWRPNSIGFQRTNGAYMNGRWGTVHVIKPNRYGKYRVSVTT